MIMGSMYERWKKKNCVVKQKVDYQCHWLNQWHPTGNRVDLLRLYIQWIIDDDLYCFNRCELPNCFPLSAIMRKYSLNWWSSTCKAITDRYFHILTQCVAHFFFDCDFEQQQQQPTIFYGNKNDLAARCDLNKSFTWFRYNYMLFFVRVCMCVCVYLTLLKRSIEAAI